MTYIKELDFQYSDLTSGEMTLLSFLLLDSRDFYSQHRFDVGKTGQNFNVTVKPKVELKRQRPSKVHLHLKDKLKKLLTQLKDADTILEMEKDDEWDHFLLTP